MTNKTATLPNLNTQGYPLTWLGLSNPGWAMVVGVITMTIYLALVPLIAATWHTTGDEPHYLLAAHSLVTDGDLDLTNNYAQFDYLNFYISKDIVPQIRLNTAGQQILNHYLGLPFLIAPAYALGGRFGVLIFQAMLGGCLAAVTFKLTYLISQHLKATLLATLLVTLSPPLLMYHYLVYPELMAALAVTTIIYLLARHTTPTPTASVLLMGLLMILPWLNRRFIPLTVVLLLLMLWCWRKRRLDRYEHIILSEYRAQNLYDHPPEPNKNIPQGDSSAYGLRMTSQSFFDVVLFTKTTLIGLLLASLSIGLLIWFNSQFQAPPRTDFVPPPNSTILWSRLMRGSIGWLVDQQRGLLIFAPIYILALWGLPALIQQSLKSQRRRGLIVVPFIVSLATVTLAGGFWLAWEVGPRFLVVALPALAPLIALAWHDYGHHLLFLGVAITLGFVSLLNSWLIIQHPKLPYTSSLPLYYSTQLDLPLTDLMPNLADYAIVAPQTELSDVEAVTESLWKTPAGEPATFINTQPLADLPFGRYQLTWPVHIEPHLPDDTPLARITLKYLGSQPLLNYTVTAADITPQSDVTFDFYNPNVDFWHTPLLIHIATTGEAALPAGAVLVTPDPLQAVILPYLFLILLLGGAGLTWYIKKPNIPEFNQKKSTQMSLAKVWRVIMFVLLLLLLVTAYLIDSQTRAETTYPAIDLLHFVGQSIQDPATASQHAWLVDPATDPPQKAIYGPFEIYDAGQYHVTFRLKMSKTTDTNQEIAQLQVNATTNFEPLINQSILAEHFIKPNLYHDLVLTITNPRRQALSFDLQYTGLAPLIIDQVQIAKVE